jgi:hypothetical protein
MTVIDWWRARQPRSAAARYVLYAATLIVVIVVSVLAVRRLTAGPDDCNKPAALVEVPNAPPGLIVDAPCTDGSAPAKQAPGPGK